jgi:NAD(P)-dependent dehydrogenase (short-subunit alcohol dehydrogenase family)
MPYALSPEPYTLRPTPYAQSPKPKGQSPKPKAQSPYAQSNSGQVRSLSLGLREECAPSGVAVACLLPGATATEFARVGGTEAAMVFNLPLGIGRRLGVVPPY